LMGHDHAASPLGGVSKSARSSACV
jgi:hypothetical protein